MQYPSRKLPSRILALAAAALIADPPPKDEAERLQWSQRLLELSRNTQDLQTRTDLAVEDVGPHNW